MGCNRLQGLKNSVIDLARPVNGANLKIPQPFFRAAGAQGLAPYRLRSETRKLGLEIPGLPLIGVSYTL